MTKVWAGPLQDWAYLTAVSDCYTREVLGGAITRRCRTVDVLLALERAGAMRFPDDAAVQRAGVHLRRDHGSQFTSAAYQRVLMTAQMV